MRRSGTYVHSQTTPAQPRDMLAAGIDIIPDKKNNLGAKREKRGECPTCGTPTHKTALFGKPKPLTVEGRVYKGRCLVCHPLEGYIRRPPGAVRTNLNLRQNQPQHRNQNNIMTPVPQKYGVPPQLQQLQPPAMPPSAPQQQLQQPYSRRMTSPPMQRQVSSQQQQWNQMPSHNYPYGHHQLPEESRFHQPTESGLTVPRTLEVNPLDDDVSVITMDHRLAQAARNWTPGMGGEVYPSDDEEEAHMMDPPIPNRRPGPDTGPYANEDVAMQRGGPPPRNAPSYHNMAGSSNNIMEPRSHLANMGMSQRKQAPHSTLPMISQERAPAVQREEFMQNSHFQLETGDYETGLDADGYPIANSGYGWDKEADLLPPGGMDMLLRNRSGEKTASNHRRPAASLQNSGEIRFQPLTEDLPVEPPLEIDPMVAMMHRSNPSLSMKEYPLEIPNASYPPVRPVQGTDSPESGPMFLPDDGPAYDTDAPKSPSQTSEPMYSTAPRSNHSRPDTLLPPGLLSSKMVGATFPTPADGMNGISSITNHRTGAMPGKQFDSKFSTESASQSTSTMAPPLVSHDRRGRPDDDVIQDPSTMMKTSYPNSNSAMPAMGTVLDDDDEVTEEEEPPVQINRQGGELRTSKKAPDRQMASRVRSESEDTGLMYIDDADERKLATLLGPMSPAPLLHFQKTPSRDNDGDNHKEDGMGEDFLPSDVDTPSSERVTAMIRMLSIHPGDEEKEPERPEVRPEEHQAAVQDIPVIMHCLSLNQATAQMREKAFRSLAGILWTAGPDARGSVIRFKGVDTLIKTMWDEMGNAEVQDAAVDFLLSLAASSDAQPYNDLLANEDTICDSLLFSMQTHSNVSSIQMKGCVILSCLAAASSNNAKVSDGSLSGALMMVLSAMSNHPRSAEIQKAGLQALFNQCALSINMESNKRSLVESRLENGSSGMDVITNAMKSSLQNDPFAMEWTCRLCWSLSSSQDLAKHISGTSDMIQEIIKLCQRSVPSRDARTTLEACLGVIGNMAHVETNLTELLRHDAVRTLVEAMQYHPRDYGVNVEACSAIANLAVSPSTCDAVLEAGGLDSLLSVLQTFQESDEAVSEVLRAMVCLAMHSRENKEAMAVPGVIGLLVEASMKHQEVGSVQEMACKLLASLAVGRAMSNVILNNGGLDLILRALKTNSDEKVQDAACAAYRNLTCQIQEADSLLQKGALNSIIQAMSCHENCLSIQMNACCSIWNIAFKTQTELGALVGQEGVRAIVKAMQTHMESSELLEAACGALWSIIDESMDRKKDVVGSGAIDAVICTLVMHPTSVSTLIKACGVFSNISAEGPLAEAIADAQGVSVVSDAMRNNASAITFLEIGCMTLRNIVYQFPEFAQEASMAISPVIEAMKENITAISFQAEACRLLWVLASEAESCQSKILALDGISVLMQCLEQNSHDARVQEAALGAFNQLAASGNQET